MESELSIQTREQYQLLLKCQPFQNEYLACDTNFQSQLHVYDMYMKCVVINERSTIAHRVRLS